MKSQRMPHGEDHKIFARRSMFTGDVDLWLRVMDYRGRKIYAGEMAFVEVPEGEETPPTLSLNETEAQRLMDELWNCGYRPSEGSGSAGAMAATQAHLEDMRKLSFQLLSGRKL